MINFDLITEQIEASKASEKIKTTKQKLEFGITHEQVTISTEPQAKLLQKAKGRYEMLTLNHSHLNSRTVSNYCIQKLAEIIKTFIADTKAKPRKSICVVGLGNSSLIADSLGARVTNNLLITRNMPDFSPKEFGLLSAFTPGVLGANGIETFDIITGIIEKTKPDVLLIIDSLCASSPARLGNCFQASDTGITPGAGVDNAQKGLSFQALKTPVIAIGVPLMIYAHTLCDGSKPKHTESLIVTPKEIDLYIKTCSHIISNAINLAVHGNECFNFL